jgi:Cu+-exporting ATPase
MAIMVGTGRGARAGVLIKNAEALETMEKVDTLVVDKTGTLTEGKPQLLGVSTTDRDETLRLAASLEQASEHPLAGSIVAAARKQGLNLSPPRYFASVPGKGITGIVDGKRIAIGSPAFMTELGAFAAANTAFHENSSVPSSSLCVAIDGRFVGTFSVVDPLRRSTPDAIRGLKCQGLRIVMITGDNRAAATGIAKPRASPNSSRSPPRQTQSSANCSSRVFAAMAATRQ